MKNRVREITAAMRKYGFGKLLTEHLKKRFYHLKMKITIFY